MRRQPRDGQKKEVILKLRLLFGEGNEPRNSFGRRRSGVRFDPCNHLRVALRRTRVRVSSPRVLEWSGIAGPPRLGVAQVAGGFILLVGAALALACVLTFAFVGRGTPAPFDPPRRLVIGGPYAFVRNPMYLGAGTALTGAALFFGSVGLLGYAALLFLITHLFVVRYEEPTLRRTFGEEYEKYCAEVHRWLPSRSSFRRWRTIMG